jgi:predicted nuclease with TOPRIM domain
VVERGENMELFGREIKLDTNITPKEAKLILLIVSVLIIGVLSTSYIVMPILNMRQIKSDILKKSNQLSSEKQNLKKAEQEYSRRYEIYQKQYENYNNEKAKFENSSLSDETDMKYMVADIAEYLNIKIVEIGETEILEENAEYIKKSIPYSLVGDINDLGKMFYYLENSNYLVSFKDSNLDIQIKDNENVSVRMNIGGYFGRGVK